MSTQRDSVTQHPIETLLTCVKSGDIAIPEIQRPFVWEATQVRNIAIGAKAPLVYFDELRQQVDTGTKKDGGITNKDELAANLETNCIPAGVLSGDVPDYHGFL